MTLGTTLRELRKERNLSQEKLAEELKVSRSAIAKWEADGGMPDVENLVQIARYFKVRVDDLLGNDETESGGTKAESYVSKMQEYLHQYCTIELEGWMDGAYQVEILGEDDRFVFYRFHEKRKMRFGMIQKSIITRVSKAKKPKRKVQDDLANETNMEIGRSYFCQKPVKLELVKKSGLIGFFDFRDDDYLDIEIAAFHDDRACLKYGKEIPLEEIAKIEML